MGKKDKIMDILLFGLIAIFIFLIELTRAGVDYGILYGIMLGIWFSNRGWFKW